ncbi:hypothetical protein LIN78_01410 [Leeia sp. TBRC 13508]|uniref:Uncharacterized protein n=1 Tax=Leeia speluncae TaxID=2884804 RepID=A0ABS8D1Y8_9NEIS|nr:hypothetical protein [Leeia speluncae]MCB6182213.1 hypothetical protein [Leeia speluncae]
MQAYEYMIEMWRDGLVTEAVFSEWLAAYLKVNEANAPLLKHLQITLNEHGHFNGPLLSKALADFAIQPVSFFDRLAIQMYCVPSDAIENELLAWIIQHAGDASCPPDIRSAALRAEHYWLDNLDRHKAILEIQSALANHQLHLKAKLAVMKEALGAGIAFDQREAVFREPMQTKECLSHRIGWEG